MNYADENQRFASTLGNRIHVKQIWKDFVLKLVLPQAALITRCSPLNKTVNINRVEENRSKSALITPRCWFFFNIFIFCIIIIWKQAVGQSLRRPPAASRPEFAAASRSRCLGRSSDALWPWGWPPRGCDAGGSSGRPGRWRRTCSLPLHSGQKPELLQRED